MGSEFQKVRGWTCPSEDENYKEERLREMKLEGEGLLLSKKNHFAHGSPVFDKGGSPLIGKRREEG